MKTNQKLKHINEINFENTYMTNLFVKTVNNPKSSQTTRGCNYTKVLPTPLENPKLIFLSPLSCDFLGLDFDKIKENSEESSLYLSGNKLIPSSIPVAHCYVGHQFGVLAGQLGDGRAITLGDTRVGEDLYEIQLKGSGLTPYSRFADGRAVLRSSIREFICSEHLWSLGIPTTRGLALVGSDSTAQRDPLYNGNVIDEECAVVSRVSPTFFRFGSFEIFIKKDPLTGSNGPSVNMENEMLPKMIHYIGKFHYNKLYNEFGKVEDSSTGGEKKSDGNLINLANENEKFDIKNFTAKLYELICVRTAILVAYWQSYSFCHGVLNTDNMSILGLTIDFGPFGFMEYFDNFYICNHSDKHGRYSYTQQYDACKWNLTKLAEAFSSILPTEQSKEILESTYEKTFNNFYYFLNFQKLGFFITLPGDYSNLSSETRDSAYKIVDELYDIFEDFGFDMTIFFRMLSAVKDEESSKTFLNNITKFTMPYDLKLRKLKPAINETGVNKLKDLLDLDPMILYSYGMEPDFVKTQIKKSSEFINFKKKYTNSDEYEKSKIDSLAKWLNDYSQRLIEEHKNLVSVDEKNFINNFESSVFKQFKFDYPLPNSVHNNIILECCKAVCKEIGDLKSRLANLEMFNEYKKKHMDKLNPKFILRNHVAQRVIESAEEGNYEEMEKVFKIMTSPYDEHEEVDFKDYETSILLAYNICVSCSS